MASPPPETAGRPRPPWADAAVLAVVFAALTVWSWGTWPDVLVDFGRELYVAWRLGEGDVLYRDVASFYGPLSPYLNGALFRVFGAGLRTLVIANLVVLAAATALLHALLRRSGAGRAAALAAAVVFLCVFAFGHMVANGSFSFVCPYAHEATHGFTLGAGALLCALRLLEAPRARWASASGLLVGLAFLTKPEGFVAGLGASLLVVLLSTLRSSVRSRAAFLIAFAGGVAAPPLLAFALLAAAMPAAEAWRGTLGSWAYLANEQLRGNWYFAWSMGLEDPPAHLAALARSGALQAALLLPPLALAWALRGRPGAARVAAAVCGSLILVGLAPFWRSRLWLQGARTLPLWTLGVLATSAAFLWRHRDGERLPTAVARIALAAFALLLLPRILLNARVYHYGFVLAAPAALLMVAALLDWIPRALEDAGAPGRVFRAGAAAMLAVGVAFHLAESQSRLSVKTVEVGRGPDRFLADARGGYVNAFLAAAAGRLAPGETLTVLPEGAMINYLMRRRSSVPYLTMLPSDEAQFGEDELLGALQRSPPAAVALVHRDTSEFGVRYFGTDYAQRTRSWVGAHYAPELTVGDPPLRPSSLFGIALLRRRPEAAP